MSASPTIDAVIVTRNRLERLRMAVGSVRSQTVRVRRIVVVDNASSDGTAGYLRGLGAGDVTPIILDRNIGGAGGFCRGLKTAYEGGADYAWLMDDDVIARPDALQRLVEASPRIEAAVGMRPGFLSSRVDWIDGSRCKINVPVPGPMWLDLASELPGCINVASSSFVSLLVPRESIWAAGYPVADFFIWYDDVEYTSRISRDRPGFLICDSVVVHYTTENAPADFTNVNDENMLKYRFGMRNFMAINSTTLIGKAQAALAAVSIVRRMGKAGCRRRHLRAMLASAFSGLFFDYRKRIEFPPEELRERPVVR